MRFIINILFFSTVAAAQLQITTNSVPTATQYQSYSTTLTAAGGTKPYTWSVVSSTFVSLPEGMSLNPSTGVVSATQVNGQGGYLVTIQVTDSSSPSPATATATLSFGVIGDATLGGCQMFPADSIYNQRIDQLPADTNPAHQIPSAYLTAPLHPDFGGGFYPSPGGIPFMRVPASYPTTNVNLGSGGQIDGAGIHAWPQPAWPNAPIEGTSYGPANTDHHILIVQSSVNNITGPQPGPCILYETYQNTSVPAMWNAGTSTWNEIAGIHYVLNSNEIAASAGTLDNGAQDSAGVPMVPLLIKYWEVPLAVQHPLRITFPSPTNWFVWPGTGCCTGSGPPQGLLYRLKASVNWQASCPVSTNPQAATLLQAMQQYGAYMSDHGSSGYVQGAPDIRWDDNDLACFKKFHVSDLEVVDNSMLEVSSLSGQTKPYVVPAGLAGGTVGTAYSATFSGVGGNAANWQWSVSAGALPPGLQLNNATGAISGTPTTSTGSPFSFSITLTDTGSGLASQPQPFSITVTGGSSTVTVTVTSAPAGLSVLVDGSSYTTPQSFTWTQGSGHTVNATSPQGTGTRYVFASWSDGGAQSHTVTPNSNTTYTAAYSTQYLLTTAVSPAGSGTLAALPASGDGYYAAGTSVQLTAAAAAGFVFSSFSGALTGSANPQSVTMSAPRAVTATFSAPAGAAAFIKTDSATGGTWKSVYGGEGYNVIGDVASTPSYVTVTPAGNSMYTWAASTSDPRALQKSASTTDRVAACWYSGTAFTIDLKFNDANAHQVALYLLDWDNYFGRTERVDIVDANNNPLDSRSVSSFQGGLYLVWNLSGHVVIRLTNTNPPSNAVMSGLFFGTGSAPPPPAGTASFVKTDSATAGTWKGAYGGDGFDVIGDVSSPPAYVTMTPAGNSLYTWAASTTDPRAPQKSASSTDRVAACWYSGTAFSIDLKFTDGNPHQVALYLLDWDNYLGRTERVDVVDANNNLLDTRTVSAFTAGEYLVWTLSGHVAIRVTNTNPSSNGVVSGLFFGPGAPNSTASFVKADSTTAGTWKGVYGADGYNVIGDSASVPGYVAMTPAGNSSYVWAASTSDPRGLQKGASTTDRVAACWYSGSSLTIDLKFNDSSTHQVALYLVDWDNYFGRTERIDVLDPGNNVLDSRPVSNFTGGLYLVWNVSGHVVIRLTNTNAASNAVISGVFFR